MVDIPDAATLATAARTILILLIDVTLKSVLILAVAGMCTAAFRRASAAAQHLIWSLALCGVLILPVLSVTLPTWRIEALSDIPYLTRADAALHESLARSVVGEAVPVAPSPPAPVDVPAPAPEASGMETTTSASTTAPDARQGAQPALLKSLSNRLEAAQRVPWTVWILFVWIGGALVVSSRFLVGAAGVWWLAFQAKPLHTPDWNVLRGEVAGHLDLRRRVRLLQSMRTAMPMTWGLLRPVVLLPVGVRDWPDARRRCVLIHELAHVKRWDCLTQTLAHIACSVNWFNPLVWVAARQMRETREMACDDRVLDAGIRPSAYAANLLDIARSTRSTLVAPLSTLSMARPSQLESRVVSILDGNRRRSVLRRWTTAVSVVVAGLLVMAVATVRPGTPAEDRVAVGEAVSPGEEPGTTVSWVPARRENAYRWVARVEPGQTVTIQGGDGLVQASPTAGRNVEVTVILDDPARLANLQVVQRADGPTVCLDAEGCEPEKAAERLTDEAVTFLVRVPEGVHVEARTRRGDVRVVGLRSDVTASTVDGDVVVQSSGFVRARSVRGDVDLRLGAYGQAATIDGHIHARLGKTTWDGALPFTSVNGNIAVALPEDADTDIDLNVEANGYLHTAIEMEPMPHSGTDHFQGRLGRGGRTLALRTRTGNVTITHLGTGTVQPEAVYEVHTDRAERPRPLEYRAGAGETWRWDTRQQVEERKEIVFALVRDGSSRAIEAIGYVLEHDPNATVRTTAVWALGEIGCTDATPMLLAALRDESTAVRTQAVQALEHLGDDKAIEPLARLLLADASQLVRHRAAEALDALEAKPTIAALRKALRDDDQQVRQAASRALDHLGAAPDEEPRLATAGAGVSVSIRTRDLRLSADFVKKMVESLAVLDNKLRLDDQAIEEQLVAFARNTRFARQFEQMGFEKLKREDLFLAHLAGVDASYVREVQRAGYCAPLKDMARLKLAGVDGDFVRAVKEKGYTELSVETLVSMRRATAARSSWSHESRSTSRSRASVAPDDAIYGAPDASGPMH